MTTTPLTTMTRAASSSSSARQWPRFGCLTNLANAAFRREATSVALCGLLRTSRTWRVISRRPCFAASVEPSFTIEIGDATAVGLDRFETEYVLWKHNVTEDLGTVEDYLADAVMLAKLRSDRR